MTSKKITSEEKIKNIKDTIYIILFLATVIGWIRSEVRSRTLMEATIQKNTEAIQKNTEAVEKINDFMMEQNKFNGQVFQALTED